MLWRKTRDPYRILVSEVMLQQTQVSRVTEKYWEFLRAFPTIRALARAPLAEVLKAWSGLGYNRRAKYLHDTAKILAKKSGGQIPRDLAALRVLPGVGEYTAGAVRMFAFNEPDTLIETNIRAAVIHHFFPHTYKTHDRVLRMYVEKAARWQDPREWHWALMDYGVHIKKLHKNPARKSAHHVRQSRFDGSLRQVRGAILRALSREENINDLRGRYKNKFEVAIEGLERDGLVVKRKGKWRIS